MTSLATRRSGFLRKHWLIWLLPLLGVAAWIFYVWRLACADTDAPSVPFIYDL
jgi:hypothetical protein